MAGRGNPGRWSPRRSSRPTRTVHAREGRGGWQHAWSAGRGCRADPGSAAICWAGVANVCAGGIDLVSRRRLVWRGEEITEVSGDPIRLPGGKFLKVVLAAEDRYRREVAVFVLDREVGNEAICLAGILDIAALQCRAHRLRWTVQGVAADDRVDRLVRPLATVGRATPAEASNVAEAAAPACARLAQRKADIQDGRLSSLPSFSGPPWLPSAGLKRPQRSRGARSGKRSTCSTVVDGQMRGTQGT